MTGKGFNLYNECSARWVCKMYTSGSIANSQMLTEINESVSIAKQGFYWKVILSNI